MRLLQKLKYSDFFIVFNWREERSKGRTVMLLTATLSNCITYLTAGTLYTAFLTVNHFSIVDTGIINFLPLIATSFSILSPIILERFRKRKWILAGARLAFYIINILGVTLLPLLVQDQGAKLFWFGVVVFTANLINGLFGSGYSVWHLNFIPNNVRARYLSYQQIFTMLISGLVLFGSGIIADVLRGTPQEATVLIILRLVGFALALLDVFILVLPKEYEYPRQAQKISLINVVRLPFKARRFIWTMAIVCAWQFSANWTATWAYYLLNTAHVSITLINALDFCYAFVLLAFSPFWRRFLKRHSWFYTFGLTVMFHGPSLFLYSFVTAGNYFWIMPVVRIWQQIVSVGLNLPWANFPYINTPKEDQTYYIAFYTFVMNLLAFLGQLTGTAFIQMMGERTLLLFGTPFSAPQLLVFAQGIAQILLGTSVFLFRKKLEPPVEEE